jgi:hypothetical protein
MSKQSERDEFIELMAREGIKHGISALLIRHAKTHSRLQTAACNGDFPADNGVGETKLCECGCGWHPSSFRKGLCPDCRCEQIITKICLENGLKPVFSGDPRGCTVKVVVPSGKTNDWGKEGICVPS